MAVKWCEANAQGKRPAPPAAMPSVVRHFAETDYLSTKNFLATTYTDLDTFSIRKATIFASLNNNKIK
jgi:hypothetical protein